MTISSVAVIASTTVSADEVVTPSEPNVTTVTEAKVDNVELLLTGHENVQTLLQQIIMVCIIKYLKVNH